MSLTPTDSQTDSSQILAQLEVIIANRLTQPADTSYVASLAAKGLDHILKKIGEEATEVVIAAKSQNKADTIYEISDLIFHLLVLMGFEKISVNEINSELTRRLGVSGHTEKAQRIKNK